MYIHVNMNICVYDVHCTLRWINFSWINFKRYCLLIKIYDKKKPNNPVYYILMLFLFISCDSTLIYLCIYIYVYILL